MPYHNGDRHDPRVTGDMIHDYLQEYAEDHDLIRRIRFNSFVETAKQTTFGWQLFLENSSDTIETTKLIVATGVTSIPHTPTFRMSAESIPLVHSRDLGICMDALRDEKVQNVIVVGAAKSAYDAVYLLLSMGKEVSWLIRSEGAGPLAILPFRICNTLNSIAFASTRLMTHLSPSILNTQGALYWLFQRTCVGRWCTARFWDFLDYVSKVHAGYAQGDHVSKLQPEIDRQRQVAT